MNFDKHTPIYLQLVALIEGDIVAKKLAPGSKLPSRRDMAARYQVNPNTVQRAFKDLEDRGIIETQGNIGSQVTQDEAVINDLARHLVSQCTEEYFKKIQSYNINKDFLKDYLLSYLDDYQGGV